MARYIVQLADGQLATADDLRPIDLAQIEDGGLLVLRVSGDLVQYAEVTSRSVHEETNDLDEVRYDQAINDRIYEVSGWKNLPRYVNGEVRPAAGEGGVTVVGEERVRESIRAEIQSDEAMRREGVKEEIREEEAAKKGR